MATKTVQEARLSINKSYKGDSLSATLNVSYSTDLTGLNSGREYADVELPAEIAAFMLSEIKKAETTLKADGAFEVAYAEPPPEPPPEEDEDEESEG
mgnify:CR=1 FL=1|tara:strand:- start:100 stop:390 length:291 start_codon:yes stop_codon:yes gene_type:complete